MPWDGDTATYSDEHGRIIPHLLMTTASYWPKSLVEAIERELRLTPEQCSALQVGTQERFNFDQLVRRWHCIGGESEGADFMRNSGLTEAMPKGKGILT